MSTELCCNRRSTRSGGLAGSGKLRSNNRRGQVSSLDCGLDKGVPILLHRKGAGARTHWHLSSLLHTTTESG